ncbi:hypothetical protein X742_01490 [Mesorhizobium sp. LNHC232B00]|nr:hypothetical protein X742_01490 [Mesorhizobium sp. LNHC232B00]
MLPDDGRDLLAEMVETTVGALLQSTTAVELKEIATRLYAAGLLEVGGATGISSGMTGAQTSALQSSSDETPPFPSTLLVKLTGACNWACTYCYDYDRRRFRESLELGDVAPVIEQMANNHKHLNIIFHGGEPLLRFKELKAILGFANEVCAARGATVRFSIQTNGSFLDEDVISFLQQNSVEVGMSIDGPSELNDQNRIDHLGRGTSAQFEKLFDLFPDFMRSKVGYITTVTSTNVDKLSQVADYLRNLGVTSWKTAIFDMEGRARNASQLAPDLNAYITFLLRALDDCAAGRWFGFRYNNILELLDNVFSVRRSNMCLKFPCGAGREFLVAAADKTIMACDATYHPSFVIGTLGDEVAAAQVSANGRALSERQDWLLHEAECATCPWFHYCAGTCMAKAVIQHGTVKAVDDFECSVRKAIFPAMFESLANPSSKLRDYYLSSRRRSPMKAVSA